MNERERVLNKVRRRHGLLPAPAQQVIKPAGVPVSFVQQKMEEWKLVRERMHQFLSGSADLPGPIKEIATLIEGNFYPNAKELEQEFRKVVGT